MKTFFLFLLLVFSTQIACSQHAFNHIYRADSDSLLGTYFGSIVATDSAYYISGLTVNPSYFHYNLGLFTKLNLDGNRAFQKTYGDTLMQTEMWHEGLIVTDDGFLMKTGLNRDNSVFLVKINPKNGKIVFIQNYYPSNLGSRLFSLGGLAPTHDGGWLLSLGETRGFHHLLVLIKTNSNGVEIARWEYDEPQYDYQGSKILSDSDGGFIVGMLRTKGNRQIDTSFIIQTHILKVDSIGRVLWIYFTPDSQRFACYIMVKTPNGGLVLAGSKVFQEIQNNGVIRYEDKGYILKLNQHRQLVWEQELGYLGDSYFNKLILKGGNIYAFGQNVSPDTSFWGAWMVKMEEESGIVDYERVFRDDSFPNQEKLMWLVDAAATPDNGFILCGWVQNILQFEKGAGDWGWVVKLDSTGCLVPGCHTVNIEETLPLFSPIQVFPNPAHDKITFQWQADHHFEELSIYDVWGKKLTHFDIMPNISTYDLPLHNFPSGVYIYVLKSKSNKAVSGKFIKQ